MRLIEEWKAVIRFSWSIRFFTLSAAIIILEPVITALVGLYTGPSVWVSVGLNTVAGLVALAGIYARVVAQDQLATIVTPKNQDK